jgi:hypothetical protein
MDTTSPGEGSSQSRGASSKKTEDLVEPDPGAMMMSKGEMDTTTTKEKGFDIDMKQTSFTSKGNQATLQLLKKLN